MERVDRTTNFGEGFSTYKEFISVMEQSPELRQQVTILFIEPWAAGDDFDIGTLTAYFPNLSRISFSRRKVSFHEYSTNTLEHPAPDHHIEYISDSNGCALNQRLSADTMCTHLVELDLHLLKSFVAENFSTLLPSLNNMPSLKHFTLGRCGYLVDDLEELHDNINTLETLNIEFSRIIKQEQNLDNVAPAETMKQLSVKVFSHDLDKCVDLLAFIRRRYTQLEHLSFYFHGYKYSEDHDELLKQINDNGYLFPNSTVGTALKVTSTLWHRI
jgi:hypothetical protein